MEKLLLPVVIVVGLAVGFLVPSSDGGEADIAHDGGSAGAWAEGAQAEGGTVFVGSFESGMVLRKDESGHFFGRATVDGQPLHMMVDTGASVVALTGSDARALGLDWYDDDVRPIARGASGDVYGVPTVIPEMRLGDLEARDVQAVIVPEGLDVSLLGQSFLGQVGRVEISGDEMRLSSD